MSGVCALAIRKIAKTAQRHREQDKLHSQAQSANEGPPNVVITCSGSISDDSHIHPLMSGANILILLLHNNQYSEQGVQFEGDPGNKSNSEDESDFDADPCLNDKCPSTPDDSGSGEEGDDLGDESSMVDGDDLVDEQLFIPRSALFDPYRLGDIDEEDGKTIDSLVGIHPIIVNTYI